MTNQKFFKTIKAGIFLLIVLFLVLVLFQKNAIGESVPINGPGQEILSFYLGQSQMPGGIPLPEITEEQAKNLERLLKMPTGKMNDESWFEILMQISCLASINEKIDDAEAAEMVRPYGVTFEEWAAYHWQALTNRSAAYLEKFEEKGMSEKLEELKKNNCKPKKKPTEASQPEGITDEVWLEITARIKCIDRTFFSFTKYEIEQIFEPFGVTPAEYQNYSEDIIKRMEDILEKNDNEWTKEDWALAALNKKLKPRIEELKKRNCVLENGTPISKEYNVSAQEPEGWDKTKCKLFSCDNCYKVTEKSSFWERYRCKNLCEGCPVSPPPPPPVDNCSGFCSIETCPAYADKIEGQCAPREKCRRCGPFKIFKCCKEVPCACCLTRPPEVCQGFCGLKECPEGTISAGEKNCPSGKEKYRCYIFLKCSRNVNGICCTSQ